MWSDFDDSGVKSPTKSRFMALKQLRVKPQEAIMIGDWAERDMVGANGPDLNRFARYGDTQNTQHSGADFEVDDISSSRHRQKENTILDHPDQFVLLKGNFISHASHDHQRACFFPILDRGTGGVCRADP